MYINEIPIHGVINITNMAGKNKHTLYTEVLEVSTGKSTPSIQIPQLSELDDSDASTFMVTYFDHNTQLNYAWKNVRLVHFLNFITVQCRQEAVKHERRSSPRIPIGIPCKYTCKSVPKGEAKVNNLSIEGFSLELGKTPVNIGEELTITFTDEEENYTNTLNGKVLHIEMDSHQTLYCGGQLLDVLNPLNKYLSKKQEKHFNNFLSQHYE